MSTTQKSSKPDRPINPAQDRNEDLITREPGSHPVGTGIGAAAAGIAGGFVGSAVGPVGTVAGSTIGAVAGGYLGHAVAEAFDPTEEDAYWRNEYRTRPYVTPADRYDDVGPAYRLGWEGYAAHGSTGRTFDDAEGDLSRQWDEIKGQSSYAWGRAKEAARDAWERLAGKSRSDDRGTDRR